MNTKLYVGNLSFDTTEMTLSETFSQFGTVTDVSLAIDRHTGQSRGFAFITFSTVEESTLAASKMNGTQLDGRPLTVNEAVAREGAGNNGKRNFGPDRKPFKARKRY